MSKEKILPKEKDAVKEGKERKDGKELSGEKGYSVGRKLLDKYSLVLDGVPADVFIWDDPKENVPVYEMKMPELEPGTLAMLRDVIEELSKKIQIEVEEISDPRKIIALKQKFYSAAKEEMKNKFPKLEHSKINVLAGVLLHQMYGLGETEVLLADQFLEEVAINNSNVPLSIYHKKYGWLKTTKTVNSEEEIYNFASQIGRKVGRQISSLDPIMDAHLLSGDRVAATLFPISTFGNTITIRKFARNPWTVVHMVDPANRTMSKEMASLVWLAMQYELNLMVAGGTASGKTSVLNAFSSLIPPTQRIISIEDTRELFLPKDLHWNWVPLTTRNANPEGQGGVNMLDLMVASLRMRPDRILVGEVRRKEHAETMFEAMHTGHSVYTTIHADTVDQIKRRLTEPPLSIPPQEVEALHLILVQYRDRRKNLRRTLELAEVLSGSDKSVLETNYLFRWRPRTDVFEAVNKSIRVYDELSMHTGMTPQEINADLKTKQDILQWMLDNGVRDVDDVGRLMKVYYKKPAVVIDAVDKRKKADFVFDAE